MHEGTQPFAAHGISVIVPVYNEASTVAATLLCLGGTLRALAWPYELIVINDGSTDGSAQAIARAADDVTQVISHGRNKGYGCSLSAGLRRARFPAVVIADADGTYPLEQIPALLRGLDGAAMVVGARRECVGTGLSPRPLAKECLRLLAERLTGHSIPDLNSGLRAMRRDAILSLEPILPARFSWTSTVTVALLLCGWPVSFLPISYQPRRSGSKFHPLLDTVRALRCIVRAAAFGHSYRLWARREAARMRAL